MNIDLNSNPQPSPNDNPAFQALMRFYEAEAVYSTSRNATDRDALLATLHPDIVLHQPPTLPYGGTWHGQEAFGQWLEKFVTAWTHITPTDPKFFPSGNNMLISTVVMHARAPATETPIAMPMCQVIRFADGFPIEWHNFAWDTAQMLEALGECSKRT